MCEIYSLTCANIKSLICVNIIVFENDNVQPSVLKLSFMCTNILRSYVQNIFAHMYQFKFAHMNKHISLICAKYIRPYLPIYFAHMCKIYSLTCTNINSLICANIVGFETDDVVPSVSKLSFICTNIYSHI